MHRSFRIPEIPDLIVSEIGVPPEPHDGRYGDGALPVLAALARTCTTFQGPALDRLWRHQETLVNFLDCFPEGLVEKVEFRRDWDGKPALVDFRLLRPMSDKDWDRPLFYSHHIKMLTLVEELHITSSDAFRALCFGAHMLPNRAELDIDTYVPNSMLVPLAFQHFDLLLCPHLVRITLRVPSELLFRIIPTLAVQCPSLSAISVLSTNGSLESLLPTVSQFVRTLVCVEELSVDNLDQAAFLHLGQLPSLKSLTAERLSVPSAITSTSLPSMYSSLKSLHFEATTLDYICRTLYRHHLKLFTESIRDWSAQ
ncbi:hypothetical protein C8R44DRAFT_759174 [Mycena epipterygia]|nr:hypothetical protein C8R44DRAFT_759174 [Mycena epipterygia]